MTAPNLPMLALGGLVTLVSCSSSEAAGPEAIAGQAAQEAAATAQSGRAEGRRSDSFAAIKGEFTQGGWVRGTAPAATKRLLLGDSEVPLDKDGSFFAAFDRDEGSAVTLKADYGNGRSLDQTFEISPRKWQISRVNVARGRGNNLEAYWAKREPEYNAIRDARANRTGAQGWKQDFVWPVKGRISGYFGRQRIYAGEPGSYHSGIDIAPGNGVPFVAPADGTVVLARTGFSLEGGIIIVDHGAGLNSAFIHLSKLVVKEGQSVRQGQYLGNVGATGRASGAHLHWSVMWNDARIDPLLLTGPMN